MAHPLTHTTVGLVIAGGVSHLTAIPENFLICVQMIAVFGSIAPDMVMIFPFVRDFVIRRKTTISIEETKLLSVLKAISHSIIVWCILITIGFILYPTVLSMYLLFFGFGGLFHSILDYFMHNSKEYEATDQPYLWPVPFDLPKIFSCDYRVGAGVLGLMKLWEVLLCMALIYVFAIL